MGRLVVRRILHAVWVILAATTLTFVLLHTAPGDPFAAMVENSRMSEATRARLRHVHGLDRPIGEQYLRWIANVARGDLGHSTSQGRPVSDALAEAIPNTLVLMGTALVLSFAVGVTLGTYQALRRGTVSDRVLGTVALAFYSLPDFWLALIAVLVFAYRLRLLPAGGVVTLLVHDQLGFWGRAGDRLQHLVLPALTLTLLTGAGIARFQRAALLDVMGEEFVRTARAKGVPERSIVRRHLLRNALVPTITLLGLALPSLLGGAAVIEKVFNWPGLGLLAVNAIATRDYFLVTGSVIAGSAAVAIGSALADVLHAAADPRVRGPAR